MIDPTTLTRLRALGLYVPPLLKFAGYHCCCSECPCTHCDGSSPPCCFKVVISGVIEGTCGECECLNDTFYAPRISPCLFQRETNPYPCDSTPLTVTIYLDGSDYKVKVELGGNVWIKNYGDTKPTCEDLEDEDIPYNASGSDCDASGSTCELTAIAGDEDVACPLTFDVTCPNCLCNLAPPNGFQVVLAGLGNSGICPNCVSCNTTYILTRQTECLYSFLFSGTCCSTSIQLGITAANKLWVSAKPTVAFLFEKTYGTPPNCRTFVNESIPLISGLCDITAPPTCLVTSL